MTFSEASTAFCSPLSFDIISFSEVYMHQFAVSIPYNILLPLQNSENTRKQYGRSTNFRPHTRQLIAYYFIQFDPELKAKFVKFFISCATIWHIIVMTSSYLTWIHNLLKLLPRAWNKWSLSTLMVGMFAANDGHLAIDSRLEVVALLALRRKHANWFPRAIDRETVNRKWVSVARVAALAMTNSMSCSSVIN